MTFLNSANADSRIKLYSYDSSGPASDGSWAGKRGVVMRVTFLLTLLLAAAVAYGCSVQQPAVAPAVAQAPARPLPFKGRLAQGDASELPSAVAMSLSSTSSVTFSYREELTHDEYHVPLIVSAFDPVTYVGAPLGDLGVTAFASLSIVDGDKVLGDYTAKVHVSKSYSLYSEPTHKEVEQAARAAVREKIDQKLYRDADRLAQAIAGSGTLPSRAADK
jgi:hypothetical protein